MRKLRRNTKLSHYFFDERIICLTLYSLFYVVAMELLHKISYYVKVDQILSMFIRSMGWSR